MQNAELIKQLKFQYLKIQDSKINHFFQQIYLTTENIRIKKKITLIKVGNFIL